jgi:hypothetical protein
LTPVSYIFWQKLVFTLQITARSLESLMEGQNWFLNKYDEIPRRSIIVCFVSLSAKAGLNLPPFEISCSWPLSRRKLKIFLNLDSVIHRLQLPAQLLYFNSCSRCTTGRALCLFGSNCSNTFTQSNIIKLNFKLCYLQLNYSLLPAAELFDVIWAVLPKLICRILQALREAVGLVPQVGVEPHQSPGQHGAAAIAAGECEITAIGGELIQVGEKVGTLGGKSGGPGVRNLSVELRLQLQ